MQHVLQFCAKVMKTKMIQTWTTLPHPSFHSCWNGKGLGQHSWEAAYVAVFLEPYQGACEN